MNCKKGDLAVIVVSMTRPHSVGKIVTCVSLKPCPRTGAPAWIIDPPVGKEVFVHGAWRAGDWIEDKCLRPIRPNDGEDETLTWAGKPEQVTA